MKSERTRESYERTVRLAAVATNPGLPFTAACDEERRRGNRCSSLQSCGCGHVSPEINHERVEEVGASLFNTCRTKRENADPRLP